MKITFLPQNIEKEVENGLTILEAAVKAGVNIDGNCAGMGTCGKCRVRVVSGEAGEAVDHHHKLSESDIKAGWRLACCQPVTEGMVVEMAESETTASRKKKLIKLPDGFESDKEEGLGVAVDIGTTTCVVMIWDLGTGEMIDVRAYTNPQGAYGADVISRIQYTMENDEGLKTLHDAVINCVNTAVSEFENNDGIDVSDIKKYAVVGNTTMSHIFLNVDPASLARAPFAPQFTGIQYRKASELNLRGADDCCVTVVPNIAGHVGSDITAGIITTDLMNCDKGHLFIDIGTNGEIVCTRNGKAATCSTAAGPAFEGSSIRQGMRAASGAIERVDITDEGVKIKTIGDVEPVGICGSGIIDAVGELIRTGIVNASGKLLSREKMEKAGLSEAVLKHIVPDGRANNFVLWFSPEGDRDVIITQKDVREVQLAKAAISAGISTLMLELGLTLETLEKVSIAGAFGSYIRNESAINIGLLPKVELEKIHSIGNSAGIGASMVLLSRASEKETEEIVDTINHVELAARPDFQDAYMNAMAF